METINIKGKDYVPVNERLKAFRSAKEFAGWQLITKLHQLDSEVCTMEAQVLTKEGLLIANGFASERRNQSGSLVNATSYVENCETSAWGRALGNLGIGIDSSICSAQELLWALEQQSAPNAQKRPAERTKAQSSTNVQPAKNNAAETKKVTAEQLTDEEWDVLSGVFADIDSLTRYEDIKAIVDEFAPTKFGQAVRDHANQHFRTINK